MPDCCSIGLTMISEDLIAELEDPECYPGLPGAVTLYQTHLSLVCVAGDDAYKLKKAIKLPFVDFSTLEKRRQCCLEEVRLNARLCPEIYLDVVPLVRTPDGLRFLEQADEEDEIEEYAVHMRRLPADRMMDVLLEKDSVSKEDVYAIANVISQFHEDTALTKSNPEALRSPDELGKFASANFDETISHCGDIFHPELHSILREQNARNFEHFMPALQAREQEGRIVDGHGDLHARNICLCDPVAIYDCIEFNRDLRIQDVATENAFLIMDLCYRGHRDLAEAYLDHYVTLTGDEGQREIMPMLVRYRAMVRAKVAAIASREKELGEPDRAGCRRSAQKHLNFAGATAVEESGTLIICTCGLPGTGKSYVLEALADLAGWPCFSSDRTRKELAGVSQNQKVSDECYSAEFSERTYNSLLSRSEKALSGSRVVLIDANFGRRAQRQEAVDLARRRKARLVFVWFSADDDIVARRIRERSDDPTSVSDAGMDVYRKLKEKFEPPVTTEDFELLEITENTERHQKIAAILAGILSNRP